MRKDILCPIVWVNCLSCPQTVFQFFPSIIIRILIQEAQKGKRWWYLAFQYSRGSASRWTRWWWWLLDISTSPRPDPRSYTIWGLGFDQWHRISQQTACHSTAVLWLVQTEHWICKRQREYIVVCSARRSKRLDVGLRVGSIGKSLMDW